MNENQINDSMEYAYSNKIFFKEECLSLMTNTVNDNYFNNFNCPHAYDGPFSLTNITNIDSSTLSGSDKSFFYCINPKMPNSERQDNNERDSEEDEIEIIELSNFSPHLSRKEHSCEPVNINQISNEAANDIPHSLNTADSLLNPEYGVLTPASKNVMVTCRIYRDKRGMEKGFFPNYRLYLENNYGESTFILAARRRKKSTSSNYLITNNAADSKRNSKSFVGKLRSNLMSTNYVLFDYGPGNYYTSNDVDLKYKLVRREFSGISYDTEVLGFKSPRKMTVIIPDVNEQIQRIEFYKDKYSDSLLESWKKKKRQNILVLHNKIPIRIDESRSHNLNVQCRVTQASVKNFQLVHDNDVDSIIMQFARVSEEEFIMDYAYPLSAFQAFGIALSSFDCSIPGE